MNIVEKILLFLHLVGMAYMLGGMLTQLTEKKKSVNRGIMDGFMMQLLTGPLLILASTHTALDAMNEPIEPMNETILTLKLASLLVMIVIIMTSRKPKTLTEPKFWSLLALTLTAVGLALFIY